MRQLELISEPIGGVTVPVAVVAGRPVPQAGHLRHRVKIGFETASRQTGREVRDAIEADSPTATTENHDRASEPAFLIVVHVEEETHFVRMRTELRDVRLVVFEIGATVGRLYPSWCGIMH